MKSCFFVVWYFLLFIGIKIRYYVKYDVGYEKWDEDYYLYVGFEWGLDF